MNKSLFKEIDALQKEIHSYRPFDKTLLQQIRKYYKIGLTYSSNALEGNTLTESETKIVLEEGITVGGKPLKDHLETIGHAEAYDFMCTLMKRRTILEKDLQQMHKLIYFRIKEASAGAYRKVKAVITGSKYPLPNPQTLSSKMRAFDERMAAIKKNYHPVEAAALLHKEFVFIHPFIDGNGRVARLLMNLQLLQEGYPIAIIPPILRREYIDSLEKAHENDGDFIQFIARMVRETQKDYLRLFLS